jgi:hypothetical protein
MDKKEGTLVTGVTFRGFGALKLELLFSFGRGKAFPRGSFLRMPPAPFYRRSFSGPLPTTPPDRTAAPRDRPATTNSSHKNPTKFATSLGFVNCLLQRTNRSGRAAPAGAVSPTFTSCRQGDSPPLRPSSDRLHGLRIRLSCTAVKLDSGIALRVGSPSPRPPAASSKNKVFWMPWGRLSGGCPPQSVVLVR